MSSEIVTADRSTSGTTSGNASGNTSGNASGNISGNSSGNTSGNDSSGNLLGNAAVPSRLRRETTTPYRFTRIYRLSLPIHNHVFGRRQQSQTICRCLHVRTGTMLLVLWHMLVHTMTLMSLTATFGAQFCAPPQSYRADQQRDGAHNYDRDAFDLPPLCKLFPSFTDPDSLGDLNASVGSSVAGAEGETGVGGDDSNISLVYESKDLPKRLYSSEVSPPLVLSSNNSPSLFGQSSNNILSDLMIACVMLPLTVLALVALLHSRPKLLHPFVIVLSLDLFCSFVTYGNVLVNLASVRQSLEQLNAAGNNQAIQLLLQLDDLSLALVVFAVIFTVLLIKSYLLRMIISCQQYLLMNQLTYSINRTSADADADAAGGGGGGHFQGVVPPATAVEPLVADTATGLPPDYETALKEFAKFNSADYPHPPPSYEAAAAAAAPAAAAAAPTAAAATATTSVTRN